MTDVALREKLDKIKKPNLENQKHTAIVLSSIEDTLTTANEKFTPTAYIAALLALLRQVTQAEDATASVDLIASAFYLLDLVSSHVPHTLLRSQFTSIVTLLAPYVSTEESNAALLKSTIGCLESLLLAQDGLAWTLPASTSSPRQSLNALLALTIDARPKIRKRAQEAVKAVLQNPPAGPSIDHPAAEACANAAQNNLKSAAQMVHQNRKQKGKQDAENDPSVIHALQLVKTVAIASRGWPSTQIESLCEILLPISRSRNEFLVMGAFEAFEVIFEGMQDELSTSKLPRLLEAIIELKPAQNDAQLLPPWIAILSQGYSAYATVEPEEVFAKLPDLTALVFEFLPNAAHNIRVSASECLVSFFANCVPDTVILDPSIVNERVLQQLSNRAAELLSVKYQTAWMEVFSVLSALFDSLRWRGNPYLLPLVRALGELRSNEGFQGQKKADEVLGHAIRALGPQAVLSMLPLNLIKPQTKQPGRAWLLPLLRDNVKNTNLAHFQSEMVPLSEIIYQRVVDHGTAEKTMDIKVYETVVNQIWSTLPGYCNLPIDLRLALDQRFGELLSNVLYQQADLRLNVCRALQNLVESNQAILRLDGETEQLQVQYRMSKQDASANLRHLASFSSNMLAVLFNVYSQTLPQSRAFVLQCINAYLGIAPEKDLLETFERVGKMLESELPTANTASTTRQPSQSGRNNMPPTSHTLLDLLIALSVHLPRSAFAALFTLASTILTNAAILASDPQLIKKSYKLIPRLAISEIGRQALSERVDELQQLIISTTEKTPIPARRDRTLAINTIIAHLDDNDLHFVPTVLSEIVLACKDSNEKARNSGFDALLTAAKRIAEAPPNTKIRNSLVPHMPNNAPDATASVEELFTMVSAGLAGVAPHMVAATITALGALLYEYHEHTSFTGSMKEELVDTVTMFVQSNNREIVRAVLGFVKVIVVILPLEALEPRMAPLVPQLLFWSKENKGRLKAKVKNILDRLVRRFGGAQVEVWAGPEAKNLIKNIRKARERARRKKQGAAEAGEQDENEANGIETYDNEHDEATYGSDDDSEILGSEEDEDDAMSGVTTKTKNTNKTAKSGRSTKGGRDQYIRNQEDSDEEPLDLLDPKSMSAISSSKHSDRPGKQARKPKARYNEDGKLVFGHDDHNDTMGAVADDKGPTAIDAYVDAISGPDAVQRGQKGRLKVKSGMQRASRLESRGKDEDMLDVDEAREVARQIMAGRTPQTPKSPMARNPGSQRRGLEGEKVKTNGSANAGIEKRRNKPAPGKRGVRFSSHPRRREQRR